MNPEKYESKKGERDKKIQLAKNIIKDPNVINKTFTYIAEHFGDDFSDQNEKAKQIKLAQCRLAELFIETPRLADIVKNNIDSLKLVGPDNDPKNFHGKTDDENARKVGFSRDVSQKV